VVFAAAVGARTQSIRIGGCVLLPHYPPALVAEQMSMLEACYPARVDLGLGRSSGADRIASALLRGGREAGASVEAYPQSVRELLAMVQPEGVRMKVGGQDYTMKAAPSASTAPTIWMLGTSAYSAKLAAEFGLPYAFGYHITAEGVREAIDLYRATFKPSGFCEAPKVLLSVIVVAAETDEEAQRLAKPQLLLLAAFRSGVSDDPQSLVEDCDDAPIPDPYVNLVASFKRTWVIGDLKHAAERLARLASSLGVEELMINPVAGAYRSDDPRRAPNREFTIAALAREFGLGGAGDKQG
jgi:luciferase family oxidoreductase group 1